jgi:branched-chain amino acid transport system ATP-binding protein
MAIFQAKDVTIKFGPISAVDCVTFDVEPGTVFTIIGPNGAGKTTLFNLISRLYDVSSGILTFEGRDITNLPAHSIAGLGIARTFQNLELFDNATVLQNLLLGRHAHTRSTLFAELLFLGSVRRQELAHREKVEEVIDFLSLHKHRDSLIVNLPYGVRKVVELARALCSEPRLLLLDEPSSGLNMEETLEMAFWIHDIRDRYGVTVLMVEHDMGLVNRVSDQVLALNYGRVIAMGTAAQVQSHPEVITAYLGT